MTTDPPARRPQEAQSGGEIAKSVALKRGSLKLVSAKSEVVMNAVSTTMHSMPIRQMKSPIASNRGRLMLKILIRPDFNHNYVVNR